MIKETAWRAALAGALATGLGAGSAAAEELVLLGSYTLPAGLEIVGVDFGGLSGLDYDRENDVFIALSDDRGRRGPPRFYELKLDLTPEGPQGLDIRGQTPILLEGGRAPAPGEIDPEALRLGPDGVVYWSQEGGAAGVPSVQVMTRDGAWIAEFAIPDYYKPEPEPEPAPAPAAESAPVAGEEGAATAERTPAAEGAARSSASPEEGAADAAAPESAAQPAAEPETAAAPEPAPAPARPAAPPIPAEPRGVRNNSGFEALALDPKGRLVVGIEQALIQDGPATDLEQGSLARLLVLSPENGGPVAEYVYPISPVPARPIPADGFRTNGLVELLARPEGGFYALERSFSRGQGNKAAIYVIDLEGASNVLGAESLEGLTPTPVTKRLLYTIHPAAREASARLDNVDNLEAMSFGPVIDGRRTLVLVSDDNFNRGRQATQILLFAILEL